MIDKKILDKFLKGGNNKYILIIVLIGIGLMLISVSDKNITNNSEKQTNFTQDDEIRLEKILKKVKGIDDVDVMISYYSTEKQDIAFEEKSQTTFKKDGDADEDNSQNNQKQPVMSDGSPVVLSTTYPKVKGVIVCYKGTDNEAIKDEIVKAVTVVTGVMSYKVAILTM